MITITVNGATVAIDPAEFGIEVDDPDLAQAIAGELEEVTRHALAQIRNRVWTAGCDVDGVWRLVEIEEAIQDPNWALRTIAKAARANSAGRD